MVDTENAAFWLPTHFLTDDDDEKHHPGYFNFDSFNSSSSSSSALGSPVSSSETEKENDDELLLTELTRQLAHSSLKPNNLNHQKQAWGYSTSPQSTLTGFGPWSSKNGSPSSPPLSPPEIKNDAAWDLLYEAAGQVAILKMNAIAAQLDHHHNHNNNLTVPRHPQPQFHETRRGFGCYCNNHHQQRRTSGGGGGLGVSQSAWPPSRARQPNFQQKPVYLTGSGSLPGQVKKQSAGTGVFIPRRFDSPRSQSHPELRKKPSVILPARVVQALNLDLEQQHNYNHQPHQSRSDSNTSNSSRFVTEHDILVARRNALLNIQRRNSRSGTVVGPGRLPNDWTY